MSGLTPEQIAVRICAATRRHDAGEGRHDAERYGPCDTHAEVAPVVAALIAEAVEESRGEVAREITAIHRPWTVCDDCDHEHTDKEVREGLAFDTGYSYTCTDAALYIACAECCVNDDEQTEECADYHRHTLDPDTRCATAALAARIARGEVSP